jgi:hypothetical protein
MSQQTTNGIWRAAEAWTLLIGQQVRVTYGEQGQAQIVGKLTGVSRFPGGIVLNNAHGIRPVTAVEPIEQAA